jgi:hypothetical protein
VVHPVSLGISELRYTRRVYRDQRGSDGSEELIVSEGYGNTRGDILVEVFPGLWVKSSCWPSTIDMGLNISHHPKE